MKLEKIKAKLASLLLTFGTIKTDKAVLEYEGEELEVGAKVYVLDEEGNKVAAADGDYLTEDNKKIVVKDGEVAEIADVTEEPAEEETKEEEVETAEEETKEEEQEPAEDKVAELEKKVAELETIIEGILEKIEKDNSNVEARLSKVEKMSASKTIEEEFEATTKTSKTGNSKVDKFIERYGK